MGEVTATAAAPKTALVLGGGGLVGGAWTIGALQAIATETRWDPGSADYVIGTSAGAMIGALVASAVPPWLLVEYGKGANLEGLTGLDEPAASRFGGSFRLHWSFPRPVLGSPGLAMRSLREPWKYGPAGIVAWLPHGVISTAPLKEVVRRVIPQGWVAHRNLWMVAVDYENGARVAFGRPGSPHAELADAVAASCAIPGFYYPVSIHGRSYIDGGLYSPSNLDLLMDTDAELIVCLNPLSSRYRSGLLGPTGPLAALMRGDSRGTIDRETLALKRAGKRVLLLEPHADDLRVMGYNYMSRRGLDRVVECAIRTTTSSLTGTELGRRLSALPPGRPDRLRRPASSPSRWPAKLFPPAVRSA
jgi:NTE family protein